MRCVLLAFWSLWCLSYSSLFLFILLYTLPNHYFLVQFYFFLLYLPSPSDREQRKRGRREWDGRKDKKTVLSTPPFHWSNGKQGTGDGDRSKHGTLHCLDSTSCFTPESGRVGAWQWQLLVFVSLIPHWPWQPLPPSVCGMREIAGAGKRVLFLKIFFFVLSPLVTVRVTCLLGENWLFFFLLLGYLGFWGNFGYTNFVYFLLLVVLS